MKLTEGAAHVFAPQKFAIGATPENISAMTVLQKKGLEPQEVWAMPSCNI
jgi:hypothetical protein